MLAHLMCAVTLCGEDFHAGLLLFQLRAQLIGGVLQPVVLSLRLRLRLQHVTLTLHSLKAFTKRLQGCQRNVTLTLR